jgi:hypothetical protein
MALRFKLPTYTPQFGKGAALNQSTLTTLYKAVMQFMENGKRVVGKLSDLVMIPHELSGGRSGEPTCWLVSQEADVGLWRHMRMETKRSKAFAARTPADTALL